MRMDGLTCGMAVGARIANNHDFGAVVAKGRDLRIILFARNSHPLLPASLF